MIVDSSALVAVLLQEPEAVRFAEAILTSERPRMSAANYLETAIVTDARAPSAGAGDRLGEVVAGFDLRIVEVTRAHADLARDAYRRFGKGHHPARLNFGDCFAYALSKETGEPLLFKGEDFVRTDVARAL